MKKIFNYILLAAITLVTGLSLTACSEDDLDTNQYKGGVSLNAFGPNPVMRGGVVRFVGSNLDQIAQVQVPGIDAITNINVVKSGIPSEITITLPKDGPEPGIITLVSKTDKKIQTLSPIAYIEPIVIESFDPKYIMPGQILTIKGDYLNLVHSITFAEGVNVSELDFVPDHHSRYEIQVVVPENASTGRIGLNDVDVTQIGDEEISYNTIESEDILQIGTPSIVNFTSPRGNAELQGTVTAKQGEKITINGEFLNLISTISVGDASSQFGIHKFEDFEVSADGKSLSFVLPSLAPDGDLELICKNGVAVPVGKIVTVKPSECVATPSPVKNGAELTITGKDMDLVVNVLFPTADGNNSLVNDVVVTETSVKVIVPEDAIDGNLHLLMDNTMYTEVAYTLVKPTVTKYSANPVSAGGALSIEGTDLDLVQSVTFFESEEPVTGDALSVSADGKLINLTVPMDSKTGEVTLTLKNQTKVKVASITVNEAVFCYATALPSEEDEIHAGATLTLPVKNIDKLIGVEINGETCQYIQSGDNLIIGIPENAKKGSKVRLISSNGEITYVIDFIPNTEQKIVLWQGMTELTWSDGGRVFLPANAFDNIPEGAELVLCYTQKDGVWAQAQINDGWWGKMLNITNPDGTKITNGEGSLVPTDLYGWFSDGELNRETPIVLTADLLAHLKSHVGDNGSMVIQGADLIFTKVYIRYTISLEEKLWEGSEDLGSWGPQPYIGAENILVEYGAKVGQIVRLYIEPKASDWKVQVFHGHWNGQIGGDYSAENCPNNVIEIPIADQEMLAKMTEIAGWGGLFVCQGQNAIIKKLTIE